MADDPHDARGSQRAVAAPGGDLDLHGAVDGREVVGVQAAAPGSCAFMSDSCLIILWCCFIAARNRPYCALRRDGVV